MQHVIQQPDRTHRSGFTLVEMLVVIGIFVILATITVAAFRGNSADRVKASAASFKNALEGARSRAISSGEPRGIRLIPDPNDGRVAHSFVYLTGPTQFEIDVVEPSAGVAASGLRLQFVPYPTPNTDPYQGRWIVSAEPIATPSASPLERLNSRGLLISGTRIEIPADSGNWYTIYSRLAQNQFELLHDQAASTREMYQQHDVYTSLTGDDPSIVDSYHALPYEEAHRQNLAATAYDDLYDPNCIVSKKLPFRIKLPPTVLPGSEPTMLAKGTAIDLDASELPGLFNSWRPDPSNPYPNASGVDDPDFYSPLMDIMFSPRGTLQGAQQSQGILNFRIAYLEDILLDRAAADTERGGPLSQSNGDQWLVKAEPAREQIAVSIFSETGQAIISEINPAPVTNGFANAPYSYAINGREAN